MVKIKTEAGGYIYWDDKPDPEEKPKNPYLWIGLILAVIAGAIWWIF